MQLSLMLLCRLLNKVLLPTVWALKADRVPRSLEKTNAQCQGDKGAPAWHQEYSLFCVLLILLAIFILE